MRYEKTERKGDFPAFRPVSCSIAQKRGNEQPQNRAGRQNFPISRLYTLCVSCRAGGLTQEFVGKYIPWVDIEWGNSLP